MGKLRTPRARWLAVAAVAVAAVWASTAAGGQKDHGNSDALQKIKHIVVVYEENHSFDNLYGGWEGVNGRSNADAARTNQIGQNGLLSTCLLQNDVNLTSPPLPADCTDTSTGTPFSSHFANAPFSIEHAFTPLANVTLSTSTVTRDLYHRFFEHQMQIDGGKNDGYAAWSDAGGPAMVHYDYSQSALYGLAKEFVLADEISPDCCRLWDVETQNKLDKDRFRRDMGGLVEAYQEVARRLGLHVDNPMRVKTGPVLVRSK